MNGEDLAAEVAGKIERVARLAAGRGLGGVLLGLEASLAWIGAGRIAPIDASREAGPAVVAVGAGGQALLIADAIEMPRLAGEELAGAGLTPVELPWTEAMADPAAFVRRARGALGAAAAGRPLASDRLLAPDVAVLERELARLRYPLAGPEIARFRALGRDAGEALGEVCRGLAPGLSEREVARRTAVALLARGTVPVVLLVGADERIARHRHPLPTGLAWRERVMVVACARRAGLTVALTRIVSAGPVPPELARRTQAAAQVLARLLAATRPGASGRELFAVAAEAYRQAGYPGEERLHHQGGACGYLSRDWIAHPACEETVASPQAFAWNPSITGTKVEETALVTDGESELLTATAGWPTLEVEAGRRLFRAPGIARLDELGA